MVGEVDTLDLEELCEPFRKPDKLRHCRIAEGTRKALRDMSDRSRTSFKRIKPKPMPVAQVNLPPID